jgi:glucokinase
MRTGVAIGIDIGGTSIAAAVLQGSEILRQGSVATPGTDLEAFLGAIESLARPWLEEFSVRQVGACTPGLLDPATGRVLYAANIPVLRDVDLSLLLGERLGVRTHVENDANAAAYGEFRFGAAADWSSVFYLTVSTGIGGGYVDGNGLLRGARGYAADVGHTTVVPHGVACPCGERGCLEAYASGTAIARAASASYGEDISTREAFARAAGGEEQALGVIEEAACHAAVGLANAAKTLDPEGLVLGGGVALGSEYFVERVRVNLEVFLRNFRPVPLRLATLGSLAGVIGAAALAEGGAER